MAKLDKRRPCPAVGGLITSAECGAGRNSRYACPIDCLFNPFALANHSKLLEIETKLDRLTMQRLAAEMVKRPGAAARALQAANAASPHFMHGSVVWDLFFERDAEDLTFAQRWERDGFAGLVNDQRPLLRAKMQTRVVLLEIHWVIDGEQLEAVDLFDPGAKPFLLVDRSLAARSTRFTTLLGWAFPLAGFWRLSGTAIDIPIWGADLPPELVLAETAKHLGSPDGIDALRRWLAQNFARVDLALTATAKERTRLAIERADIHWCKITYELRAPLGECVRELDAGPSTGEDDLVDTEKAEGFIDARVWFEDSSEGQCVKTSTGMGQAVLGRVLIGRKSWQLEAMSGARTTALRAAFEARLGDRMRFVREERDDLSHRIGGANMQIPDPALVVPSLLGNLLHLHFQSERLPASHANDSPGELKARALDENLRAFLDDGIPALRDRTPREAASDPQLRPLLVTLMKQRVQQIDENNLENGRSDDIDWALRELGLFEIVFPPPPRRIRPEPPDYDEPDLPPAPRGSAGTRSHMVDFRPAPDRIAPDPWNEDEAFERLERGLATFDTAAEAMDELRASGSALIDDLSEVTEGLLNDKQICFLVPLALQIWFAFVPPGRAAPSLRSKDELRRALEKRLDQTPALFAAGPEGAIKGILGGCRQPALLQIMLGQLAEGSKQASKAIRPDPAAQLILVSVISVVIDELDLALRC